jgi:hypothetical protein
MRIAGGEGHFTRGIEWAGGRGAADCGRQRISEFCVLSGARTRLCGTPVEGGFNILVIGGELPHVCEVACGIVLADLMIRRSRRVQGPRSANKRRRDVGGEGLGRGGMSGRVCLVARAVRAGVAVVFFVGGIGGAVAVGHAADELPRYGVPAPSAGGVDTALVVSVDVSSSVDERRYQIQLEGIAAALEDRAVIAAILSGPRKSILFSVVTWADRPKLSLPWIKITSKEDALLAALKVRTMRRDGGDFTCLSKMLRFITDKIVPQIPERAGKVVVDVSGDGSDNCNAEEPAKSVRDEMNGRGTTINGLPILEGREAATLEGWYRDNVMGGPGAFILPAQGFEDFGRAIRQKFVVEISLNALEPPMREAGAQGARTAASPRVNP